MFQLWNQAKVYVFNVSKEIDAYRGSFQSKPQSLIYEETLGLSDYGITQGMNYV